MCLSLYSDINTGSGSCGGRIWCVFTKMTKYFKIKSVMVMILLILSHYRCPGTAGITSDVDTFEKNTLPISEKRIAHSYM